MARTPMSFLVWFKWVFENADHSNLTSPNAIRQAMTAYTHTYYTNIPLPTLEAVAATFGANRQSVTRADILAACNGDEAILAQLQDRQVILPWDFWNPTEFTFDPELHFLCP